MKLFDALVDIATQLGDENLDVSSDRAQAHLVSAMEFFIDAEGFVVTDIPAYHRLEKLVDFSSQPYNMVSLDVYLILNIYPDPAVSKEVRVTLKDVSELGLIPANDELKPSNEDIFIYRIGNDLRAIVNSTDPNFSVSSDKLFMEYIREIEDENWVSADGGGTDLTDARGGTLTSGNLVIGVVYEIEDFITGDDFSNVGGVNQDNDFFVATGKTPTDWSNNSVLRRQKLFSRKFVRKCILRAVETIKAEDEERN